MKPYAVKQITLAEAKPLIAAHYLHKRPAVCVMTVGLLDGEAVIGCIVFASPPKQTFKRYGVKLAWELARLYIIDDTPRNTETWFVSRAIKLVRTTRPDVELLVSYADPAAGHAGTIYKAGNWIADGRTDQERKTPRFDRAVGDKIYSRYSRVPPGAITRRVYRVSKWRFIYYMADHEKRRTEWIARCSGVSPE